MSEVKIKTEETNIEDYYPEIGQLLNVLPGNNTFSDDRWEFDGVVLDFSILRGIISEDQTWQQSLVFDPVNALKGILLLSLEGSYSPQMFRYRFDLLAKTLVYMQKSGLRVIANETVRDYIEYILMHGQVGEDGPTPRLTPVSAAVFNRAFVTEALVRAINELNIEFMFDKNLRTTKVRKETENAIEVLSGGDLTYQDWCEGGSLNYLTLDYGQYYVEHCADFFDKTWALSSAIKKTQSEAMDIARKAGSVSQTESLFNRAISHVLSGFSILDNASFKRTFGKFLNPINDEIHRQFATNYSVYQRFERINKEEIAIRLGKECACNGINPDSHKVALREFIKAFVATNVAPNQFCDCLELYKSRLHAASQVLKADFNIKQLQSNIETEWDELKAGCRSNPPTSDDYEDLGIPVSDLSDRSGPGSGRDFESTLVMRRSSEAGITLLVALTGWRESEYGFSPSDIYVSPNKDALDLQDNPLIYSVFWYVNKTNGSTKLSRDITTSCADIASKLFVLSSFNSGDVKIYPPNLKSKDQSDSRYRIVRAVRGMWKHFVCNYSVFTILDNVKRLQTLHEKSILTSNETEELKTLTKLKTEENWDHFEADPLVNEAYRRARNEVDRVLLLTQRNYETNKLVWALKARDIDAETLGILDSFVSSETKNYVCNLTYKSEITPTLAGCVMNEIVADCLYPTPHAFRHMWAESVYRRFDGDVGWLIRSNFKHISQNMWLAYIRNKDNRSLHNKAKRKVISSLLANYLYNAGNGYAGAMDKLLRRVFLKTSVYAFENIEKAISEYADIEIEDIKSNPWGFCLLKRRNKHLAKCAVNGEPQRQNAAPSLCLGCTNFMGQTGNVSGIIMGISNDLNCVSNPKIPEAFRKQSRRTVKNALTHLKKLNVDAEILSEIEDILQKSGNSEPV